MTAALAALAIACALQVALRRWIVVQVRGISMLPTLRDGERLLARRLGPRQPVRRGDLVVFRPRAAPAPGDPPVLIKRVAAVAGDPVPPWIPDLRASGPWVPAGHVVVHGDNPRCADSRQLGYISRAQVVATISQRHLVAALDPKDPCV
jgi:signal peptidase I